MCCNLCNKTPDCKLFVVTNHRCCLKRDAGNPVAVDPLLNVRASFARWAAPSTSGPRLATDKYSPDVRTDTSPIGFGYVTGAQWFADLPSTAKSFDGAMLDSIAASVNATVSTHAHGQVLELDPLVSSDGAKIFVFWQTESAGECAAIVSIHGLTFFTYSATYRMCLAHRFPTEADNPTYLKLSPSSGGYKAVDEALSNTHWLVSVAGGSLGACQAACSARTACVAVRFTNSQCTLLAPSVGKSNGNQDSVAGYVTTTFSTTTDPNLPAFANPTKVHFYATAHQDDHELFMADSFHYSIADDVTKVVFIYASAGDAGRDDKWWRAREAGTLATSETWVDHMGRFKSSKLNDEVTIQGHRIQMVSIGNTVHYFLRLREETGPNPTTQPGLLDLLTNGVPPGQAEGMSPLDKPNEVYATRGDVYDVVKGIILKEANGIAKVELHTHDQHNNDNLEGPPRKQADNLLHLQTGRLVEEIIDEVWPLPNKCVPHRYYEGYHGLEQPVNVNEQVKKLQRYAWMQTSLAIFVEFGEPNWSSHAVDLGRTYPTQRTVHCP
ncbi:Aste57867_8737 [Aphanomyces stellatus]|uniref:Aste57867_8737 protein n=1 Tax=Aphanomyces stellatus TaxID=120398 RepID=A0A485KL77_9STRA|nr:hypothetical protein As57867_008703 [Aphanomyces stellatus]VFT85623.1 Aste57867_8737 [Aphanomyces stellatus]